MKLHRSLIAVVTLSLSFAACSSNNEPTAPVAAEEQLEPEDLEGSDGEGKFEAWNSSNNPAYVDANFAYFIHQLPLKGHGQVPIPGDYWATAHDNINYEWDGPGSSPAEKYAKAFNQPGVPEAVTNNHGIYSASKTCTPTGNECKAEDGSCQVPRGKTDGRCVEGWWGICHGWAPYAISEPAARKAVTHNDVTFYPGDLEGLMSLMYTNVQTKFLSSRCNKKDPVTDPTGRITADECRDMNPGSWHVLVTNMMGMRNKGFVIDATLDYQVWNQPSYGYEITNGVEDKPKEITKAEAISMLGADLKLTEILGTTTVKKGEQKAGEYTAPTAGDYTIKMSGSGDADLYIKKGAAPTADVYDCRPYGGTSVEECKVTLAQGEKVFWMINGYAETSDVQLGSAVPGQVGEYKYNTSAARFFYVEMNFTYIVESRPARESHVDQALTQYATTKTYKYIVETDASGKILGGEWVGNSRTEHPDFAWWPAGKPRSNMAGGLITYENVKMLNDQAADLQPPVTDTTINVMDNVKVNSTGSWNSKYASFDVPAGVKKIVVNMTGEGDADLYVRISRNPTVYTFNCKSTTTGTSTESCTITDIPFGGGKYFVRARTKTAGTVVSVKAVTSTTN